jgi:protease IV
MHRRITRLILLSLLLASALFAGTAFAERLVMPFADYRSESWYLPQSPAVTAGPVASFFNPASWAMTDKGGTDFWWNNSNVRSGLDNYGFSLGRDLGFAMNTTTFGTHDSSYKIYDYQLGLSHGTKAGTFGLGYRWAHGETQRTPREKAISAGFISRKRSWMTFGTSGVWSVESNAAQYIFDMGIRPFNRPWITIYGDYTANDDQSFFKDGYWGAGLEIRPVSGLHLGLKARQQLHTNDTEYSALIGVTFKSLNFTGMPRYDHNDDLVNTSFLVRGNPPFSGLPIGNKGLLIGKANFYYPISLENKVLTYQKHRYFDDTNVAWLDLMRVLDQLRDSDQIKGVAINMAGLRCRSSLLWEFRQKIDEIKASGKEVVIHIDRATAGLYYLASSADRVTMDPYGGLQLPGVVLGRSYLKGTLEKLGIGFQAHRYFKYKSAVETLSRDSMSEADREQRQRIVDVIYETMRDEMAQSRGLNQNQIDGIIDEMGELVTQDALDMGLVDASARWDQLGDWLRTDRQARLGPAHLIEKPRVFYDNEWGPHMKIPVVYAVGECAMDSGIMGRKTSAYLRSLIRDPNVAAVVLRADSPGGDPLPSDLITDAVIQLKKAGKPVIVSQGDVAASGGYWISMEGTKILTTPLTITGSIGVISGWIYDDGMAAKSGITAESVQRGAHADLFSTVNFPFIGGIPRRPMNDSELERAEKLIRGMYEDFVAAVSKGRGLSVEQIHEVAQGRVWMGGDAIEHGLCDDYGSLSDAIDLAREYSGVSDWRHVEIVEYPPRPMFKLPDFGPSLPGIFGFGNCAHAFLNGQMMASPETGAEDAASDLPAGLDLMDANFLRQINGAAGQPVMMMSPDMVPEGWREME